MMDAAGIDAAWLTSAQGMCADLETSRFINDKAKKAERDYPGRFIGAAHAHPLGGPDALRELDRCRHELGFQGVVITSECDGLFLDDAGFEPFWTEAEQLGMFVFVHPALKLNFSQQFDGYDTARSVGREFSLIMATIRLINSGVFDRHPQLDRAHGASLRRHRLDARPHPLLSGQGVLGHQGQCPPRRDAGARISTTTSATTWCSTPPASAARSARSRPGWSRFRRRASCSPPTIRRRSAQREPVRDFVRDMRALGTAGEQILSGNVGKLLKQPAKAA